MVSEKSSVRGYSDLNVESTGWLWRQIRDAGSVIARARDPKKRNQLSVYVATMSGISSEGARMTELRSAE